MTADAARARLSPLDVERFGIRTARLDALTEDSLSPTLDFCRNENVRLLIAHCRAEQHAAIRSAESERFELMDVILVFERRLTDALPKIGASVDVRPARSGEERSIIELAENAFKDYVGHYHADPRLDRARTAEIYPDWTRRLLEGRDADHEMLIAEADGEIIGFHAVERRGNSSVLPLSAVRRGIHRKHVYQTMNARGMEWAVGRGAQTMVGSVQLANTAIQRALVRLGFLPDHAYFTFHKWFD